MTRADHVSGTDRVAEAASASNAQIIVNIQGDEPMIDPAAIDAAVLGLLDAEEAPMGTLKTRIFRCRRCRRSERGQGGDRCGGQRDLLLALADSLRAREADAKTAHFKHIGLYVYRRDFLLAYPDLPVGPLERAERLEQLRALENGFKIRVVETDYDSLGVDTPEDWERISELFEKTTVVNTRS